MSILLYSTVGVHDVKFALFLSISIDHIIKRKFKRIVSFAGPPKALDEDETEFLDRLEMVR